MDPKLFYAAESSSPGKQNSLPPVPDFTALATAFSHQSDKKLRLTYLMFRLMAHPGLMKAAGSAVSWAVSRKLPVKPLIKHTIYKHFCGGESASEALQVVEKLKEHAIGTVLDYAAEAEETEAGFENVKRQVLLNIELAGTKEGIEAISVKLSGLGRREVFERMAAKLPLTENEKAEFERTGRRLEEICRVAAERNLCIYLDAEESWMQEPMDALAEHMMQLFNSRRVVVFNTLQMYRTDRLDYLQKLIARTEKEPFLLGIKLVRGAYWEKEREHAAALGQPSPVFATKEETDHHFNEALLLCLAHLPRVQLCIATHNQESTELLVQEILRRGIYQHQQWLHFSQLYGMSDNLSYGLARAGFSVSKYLPYGEVEKALPYLIRRAEENSGMAGQMGRELQLLHDELERRTALKNEKSWLILKF